MRCRNPRRRRHLHRSNRCGRTHRGDDRSSRRCEPEVVAQRLDEVRRKTIAAESIEECQSRAVGRDGYSRGDRGGNDASPSTLSRGDRIGEMRGEQEVAQPGVVVEGVANSLEKRGADDAALAPEQCDAAMVQFPVVLVGGCAQQHEALGVRDDLGGIQRLLEVDEHGGAIAVDGGDGSRQHFGSTGAVILEGRYGGANTASVASVSG